MRLLLDERRPAGTVRRPDGRRYAFELVMPDGVAFGDTLAELVSLVIPGAEYPNDPASSDWETICRQASLRRQASIEIAESVQQQWQSEYTRRHPAWSPDRLAPRVRDELLRDKGEPPTLARWHHAIPIPLALVASSALLADHPRLPEGRVTIIDDLDEESWLRTYGRLASPSGWQLVRNADADIEEPW